MKHATRRIIRGNTDFGRVEFGQWLRSNRPKDLTQADMDQRMDKQPKQRYTYQLERGVKDLNRQDLVEISMRYCVETQLTVELASYAELTTQQRKLFTEAIGWSHAK